MRRSLIGKAVALVAALGLALTGVGSPAVAISGSTSTMEYPIAHFDDVPATALATVEAHNGELRSFYLANGLLYSAVRSGNSTPSGSIGAIAPQLPGGLSDLKTATNAAGDIGVVYTCASNQRTNLCALIDSASGTHVTPVTLVADDVLDFDIAWTGSALHVVYSASDVGRNPFDAARSKVGHAQLSLTGEVTQDTRNSLFVDPSVNAFNVENTKIAGRGDQVLMAWESYESTGAGLRYVVRAAVVTDNLATSRSAVVLPGTFSDVTRVRALGVTWLEANPGLVPTVMWVGDLGVFSAAEVTPGSWTAGNSSPIEAQVLLADVYSSAEPALYAVVKTRHLTTPPITSYQLTDSRLALNVNVILANGSAVTELNGYLMPGKNPGVLLCTNAAVSLVDAITGSVTRTKTLTSLCSETQVFDHSGAWVFYGISSQGYSATQNSPHVLVWVDSAAPVDLSNSSGRIVDQQIISLNLVRILAYVVREWTDPTTPSLTHDRLMYKVVTDGSELASTGEVLSSPAMTISHLTWIKTSQTKVSLVWQESASTLYTTTASRIKAVTYDTETRTWTSVAQASHNTFNLLSIAAIARPASGATALGGVLIDAGLGCSACMQPPTRGIFVYQPVSNTFTLESAAGGQGAPASDAVAFADGSSGWIYASSANNFEPHVVIRSVAEGWVSSLPFRDVAIEPSASPVLVANGAGNAEAGLGAVVWNEAMSGSVRGSVMMRRLTHESSGGFKIWSAIAIATNATLVGRPVIDNAGTLWMVVSSGSAIDGFEHQIVSVTNTDVVTRQPAFNTVDEYIKAIPLADTRGYVAIAVLDRERARIYQPQNLPDTRWADLQPTNYASPFEISAASDDFGFVVSQYKQLTVGRGVNWWTTYPFPDFTPLTLSATTVGIPAEPGFPAIEYAAPLKRTLTFDKGVVDARVRLQWFDPLTSNEQLATTDDDGVISVDVTDPKSSVAVRVRWVENYGTPVQRNSQWRTYFIEGILPQPVTQFSGTWISGSSLKVTWTAPVSKFAQTFRVELIENGGSVTRSFETSGTSATFTNVKPSASIQYTVRTLQFGAEASAEYQVAAARVAPSAPRSVAASKDKTALKVAWSVPATAGSFAVTGYKVEMRIGTASWKTVATTKSSVRLWKLLKPTKGKKYSFRITALNGLSSPFAASKTFVWKG